MQTAIQRVKVLEESVEAERAAHLEFKVSAEVIQVLPCLHHWN